MLTIKEESKPLAIHPTAIIERGASLAPNVVVGPYAYIGEGVTLGAGTIVHHHATVEGFTQMGEDNEVFPYASIGSKTHDLKHKGGKPGLKIGSRNTFREYVSVHCATNDAEFTVLGDDNVLLSYSHVAHDCQIGNHLIMSSHAAIGGHAIIDDYVNISWGVGVHQFCKVGAYAMIGACSKLVQDVPPFMIADGNPAQVRTINKILMERMDCTTQDIEVARFLFKKLYKEGLNRTQALENIQASKFAGHWVVIRFLEFSQKSTRGFA